jgi:hypothetical protein
LRRRLGVQRERQDAHVMVGVLITFYVGSGLELKHREMGEIQLPWNGFFPPTRRACGRRFHWGNRSWRASPRGYEFFELKILTVSTVAPPH